MSNLIEGFNARLCFGSQESAQRALTLCRELSGLAASASDDEDMLDTNDRIGNLSSKVVEALRGNSCCFSVRASIDSRHPQTLEIWPEGDVADWPPLGALISQFQDEFPDLPDRIAFEWGCVESDSSDGGGGVLLMQRGELPQCRTTTHMMNDFLEGA